MKRIFSQLALSFYAMVYKEKTKLAKYTKIKVALAVMALAVFTLGCSNVGNNNSNESSKSNECDNQTQKLAIDFNGHTYVDLGLPSGTLWATCNVGASSPKSYGNYYAWGETRTKSTYSNVNYSYNGNPNSLPSSADVAATNWGGDWRMPTDEEIEELVKVCNWRVVYAEGYEVTGPNGQSIFLPAAGVRGDDILDGTGRGGCYWTNTIHYETDYAYVLYFSLEDNKEYVTSMPRTFGYSVRAVCSKK